MFALRISKTAFTVSDCQMEGKKIGEREEKDKSRLIEENRIGHLNNAFASWSLIPSNVKRLQAKHSPGFNVGGRYIVRFVATSELAFSFSAREVSVYNHAGPITL
jgi:hypothetical protein